MNRLLLNSLLIIAVFACNLLAQNSGSSVMAYSQGAGGSDAEAISRLVRDQILIGLEKYPCVDQMDENTLGALIGWQRMRDLLGAEANEQKLKELGEAVGARYVIVVKSVNLPTGTVYTNVVVLDTVTGKMVANRENQSTPNDGSKNGDALAALVLQDLSNLFKGKCDPHWTGTISYSTRQKEEKTASGDAWGGSVGVMEKNAKFTMTTLNELDDTVEAVLRAMTDGVEGQKTMARVAHRYAKRWERNEKQTSEMLCRPRGKPSYLKSTNSNSREFITENGENTQTLPVSIVVFPDGQYKITVRYPGLTTTQNAGKQGVRDGCEPRPFDESNPGEGTRLPNGYFEIEGKADPKNPNELFGKTVTGNLATKQLTIVWKLKLVTPKKK
ncbi:MAG: hypothetical protein IPJ30_01200 [Acidobacteria bacterium]|nr:hypothetical protein [Acidobacteriota bacterium]